MPTFPVKAFLAKLCAPYGVLGPYKIERHAKLPQRSKTVTTGLGSIKTTWIRVYSASNHLLGLENGWPFRRFGGGAAPTPSPVRGAQAGRCSCPDSKFPRNFFGNLGGLKKQVSSKSAGNLAHLCKQERKPNASPKETS